jgi:hypothetical protein
MLFGAEHTVESIGFRCVRREIKLDLGIDYNAWMGFEN